MKPRILLFTNGKESTWPSIEYAAWMAGSMHTHLTLVGINESGAEDETVEEIFGRSVALFQEKGIDYSLQLESGNAEEIIPRKANQSDAGMILLGPLGRSSLRRLVVGRSFRRLMAEVSKPILYIPAARFPISKMLICLGGLGYGLTAEHLGVQVASMTGASVTLLTVVPTTDLDYPEARKIRENWKKLAETDTLPGRTLRKAIEVAIKSEVPVRVTTRHGNVVEEILDEIRTGGYDMVCMGSPFSAHSLRQLVSPNITADIAEEVDCPILTARFVDGK